MKRNVSAPQLVMCATTWSMIGYPSPKREWSVPQKLRAIKAAGFDGVCAFITPEIASLAGKLGLRLMSGFDARSVGSGASLPKRREANLSAVWRPPDVPGLQIRAFGSLVHQDDRDRLYHTVGVTIDFELPLF